MNFAFALRRRRAGLQRGKRLRDLAGRGDGDMDVVRSEGRRPRSDLFDSPLRRRLIVVSLLPKACRKRTETPPRRTAARQGPRWLLRSRRRSYAHGPKSVLKDRLSGEETFSSTISPPKSSRSLQSTLPYKLVFHRLHSLRQFKEILDIEPGHLTAKMLTPMGKSPTRPTA